MNALKHLRDSIQAFFKRQAADASDMLTDVKADMEADLGAREARLAETPMDAIGRLQGEIADHDGLDEVRRRIDSLTPPDLD